jgi:hypothetical protein
MHTFALCCVDMLSNYITDNMGSKSVVMKTLHNGKVPVYYT